MSRTRIGIRSVLTPLCCAIALGHASSKAARAGDPEGAPPLGAGSACALAEGVPAVSHPIRKHPSLRPLFGALDAAGNDRRKNRQAMERIERLLTPLYSQAEQVFARAPAKAGEEPTFKLDAARAFLERWVLAPSAPLRLGRDRLEPAPELAAAFVLAACRAGERAAAIRLARGLSGAETSSHRAFAALLLIEEGRAAEARELVPELGDEGFVAPFVAAELAAYEQRSAERDRLHALARRHIQTPDQEAAWQAQARRFGGAP